MKWVLFFIALLLLFFADDVLFWVTGNFVWPVFVLAGVIALAVSLAKDSRHPYRQRIPH